MTFGLIPPNPELGKMPYVWLAYLGFFIAPYFVWQTPLSVKLIAVATIAVFLIIYCRSFWLSGPELGRHALMMTILGAILCSQNQGASCFFIYSACSGTGFARLRSGMILVGFNVIVCALCAWFFQKDPSFWLPGIGFSILFGCSALFANEVSRTRNRMLRRQEDIEQLAKIAERERIARDLHDVLGHTLTIVALKSELARKLTLADKTESAVIEMREVEIISRDALQQVREAISGYRSAGLAFELEQAKKALEGAQVRLVLQVDVLELPSMAENALSLVLREAVTNIIRHSHAGICKIRLQKTDIALRCDVTDDGVGLGHAKPGNGLSGMRERIEALGGNLDIASAKPGTCVTMLLPLPTLAHG